MTDTGEYVTRRTALKAGTLTATVGLAGCTDDGDTIIEWHAGGEGGTYFPLSGDFKSIVDDETDFTLQVESTGASVENAGSLGSEDADFALIQNDVAFFAREGTGIDAFDGDPIENIRGVATLYPETIHVVTNPDSNIASIADMEGATVNTGDLGSGTQVNALTLLEEVAGLEPGDDFIEENTAFGPATDQIRDGDIDAAFVVGGWPVGAVQELAETADMGLLDLADQIDEAVGAADWFAEDEIPGGTYDGIDEETTTVSVQAMIATHTGVAAETVEEVTNTIFDNLDDVTVDAVDFISRDTALDGMPVELHEGADGLFD